MIFEGDIGVVYMFIYVYDIKCLEYYDACVEDGHRVSKVCALVKRKCHWAGYRDVKYKLSCHEL